ncbi:hypothetical protein ACOMHN_029486 [Nucella lapillus]
MKAHSSSSPVCSHSDLLVWFEICELAPSGEYVPVVVDHSGDMPTQGGFMLHQGIQRRIRITLVHERREEVRWRDIREVVVGRIRNTQEYTDPDSASEENVLSLSLFPAQFLRCVNDDRVFFQFEAAWDSSLHNSPLLNRVTPGGDSVYMTLSAYVESRCCGGCALTWCVVAVGCVMLIGSPSPRFRALKSLFGGSRSADCNKVTGIYELLLRKYSDSGSPGVERRRRRVLDTSSTYVRGEENLNGWRPRGDSLLVDHQWELEKLTRLQLVEKTRHVLLLREKLTEQRKTQELCKLDKEILNTQARARNSFPPTLPATTTNTTTAAATAAVDENAKDVDVKEKESGSGDAQDIYTLQTSGDRDTRLMARCVRLMLQGKLPLMPPPIDTAAQSVADSLLSSTLTVNSEDSESGSENMANSLISSISDLAKSMASMPLHLSRSSENMAMATHGGGGGVSPGGGEAGGTTKASSQSLSSLDTLPQFTPDVEEVRVSPVVSRRGHLNFLNVNNWVKKWVVVRRPYVLLFNSEKDPVVRALINLATADIQYSEDQQALLKTQNVFTVMTKTRGFLMQTLDDKDFHDWLYAINPLLAGQIRSKLSRRKQPMMI